jgi:hypothetical protein
LKRLHNEEFHNLYSLPNIIRMVKSRMMTWARLATQMDMKRNACMALAEKPEGNRPLRRP